MNQPAARPCVTIFPPKKKHPFRTPIDSTLVGRLNNTVRERNKVQRGWKKDNTPLRNGQMIYYNHIRPHDARRQTPAEVAGLPKETWKSLLRKSLNKPMR